MAMVDRAGGIAGTGEAGQPLASSGMTMLQDARRRRACIVGNGEARERSPAVAGLSL